MSANAPPSDLFDCFADPELLPADEATRRIAETVVPVVATTAVSLRTALGRVLATPVVSPLDVPGFRNSAMDGFAVKGAELAEAESRLRVLGTAWAGKPYAGSVESGQAVQIMTGAVMPDGTDTVVMQEQTVFQDGMVIIGSGHTTGQNVREAGEDLLEGATVLEKGRRLTPADLGLLASLGIGEADVYRQLKVATFSTGDELRSIGEPLEPGALYDSNRYTLLGLLTRAGVEITDLGVIRDRREAIRDAFKQASDVADVVLTSGGASAGDADFVSETLRELGQVGFWRIAIRPGRPLAFGKLGDAYLFGLPGNPVAVMVTFYQFVLPALRRLAGEDPIGPEPVFKARTLENLRKKPGRVEYYRAVVDRNAQGELVVRQTGKSGSALLHTMSDANCFIVLPDESGAVDAGDIVDVQPFFGLV